MRSTEEILQGIERSTGRELLNAVRYTTAPPGRTYIPALDNYLTNDDPSQGNSSSLQRGDMIEITGPSGSGKTAFLVHMLLVTLLPDTAIVGNQNAKIAIGGKKQQAMVVQSAARPSILSRVEAAMEGHLLSLGIQNERHRAGVIEDAMRRLTIFTIPVTSDAFELNPNTSPYAALVLSLTYIPRYIRRNIRGEISLIAIDGFGDEFWQSRWMREKARSDPKAKVNGERVISAATVGMDEIMVQLSTLRKDLGCVIMVTVSALWKPQSQDRQKGGHRTGTAQDLFWAQHLPPPWPNPFHPSPADSSEPTIPGSSAGYWPLTAHITLTPLATSLKQFRPDITLEEVWREGGEGYKREMARREGVFRGFVRLPRGGGERLVGEFQFRMGREGLRNA